MNSSKYKIAIDAMGGDNAPEYEIKGVFEAVEHFGKSISFLLLGDESSIKDHLANHDLSNTEIEIIHTTDNVRMDEEPSNVLKNKKKSSLYQGIELLKSKKADAFLSAGNTGAVLAVSTIVLGRIEGVSRPTIGTLFPTIKDKPVFLVDAGANAEVKPKFLFEFGIMGSIFMEQIYNIKTPKTGLLNIGEEETKGTDLQKEANKLMKNLKGFVGNVEGRDIFKGETDVVVTDGFTGNVVLKFAESINMILKEKIRQYADRNLINKIKVAAMVPTLKDILKEFDYQEYGGVPLLGVNGNVIIGHGKSTPKAFKNMIFRAVDLIDNEVNEKISKALKETSV
jgi:glycerol-3-phosphate acyltransferase PlsX